MSWRVMGCLLILLTGLVQALPKKDEIPLPEAPAKKTIGAEVTFRSLGGKSKGQSDTRASRLIALYVPANHPPTPFLEPGPFQATFKAQLRLKLRGKYTISAQGRGKLKVSLNDKTALEAEGEDFGKVKGKTVSLNKRNELVVEYESPKTGDAWMRLYWSSEQFAPEPIAASFLQHDANGTEIRLGRRLREGRELWTGLRCLKCHEGSEQWIKAKGMPELERDAPSLADIGGRLHGEWMARWIQDPKSLRPTATMPRIFADSPHGLEGKLDPRVIDIATYLSSLGKEQKSPAFTKKQRIEGQRLFGQLGCIGCHVPPGKEIKEEDDFDRVPLRDVGAKWKPAALQEFLQDPDKHYQWIRMPNLHLTAQEAGELTAYLTSVEKRKPLTTKLPAGNKERGLKLVTESGCLNCHQLDKQATKLQAPKLSALTREKWNQGCLSEMVKDRKGAPLYTLKKEQKDALLDVLLNGLDSFGRRTATEFASRHVKNYRCIACHQRDDQVAYWTDLELEVEELLSELPPPEKKPEGLAMLQMRPPLTWVGEKLHPLWMTALFSDKLDYKPRPFLRARMPAFPRHPELLARGLAMEHGFSPSSKPSDDINPKLAEIGRDLVGPGKWNCVGCHDVGSRKAVGVFEAPGVNFAIVRERLRPEYFERWMWSPTRIWPGTKMPTVYQWGNPSQLRTVLDGDASKQIDALWNYLLQGKKITPPK